MSDEDTHQRFVSLWSFKFFYVLLYNNLLVPVQFYHFSYPVKHFSIRPFFFYDLTFVIFLL